MNACAVKFLSNFNYVFGFVSVVLILLAGVLFARTGELHITIVGAGIGFGVCIFMFGGIVQGYAEQKYGTRLNDARIAIENREKRSDKRKLAKRSPEEIDRDRGRYREMSNLYWKEMSVYPQPPNMIKWLSEQTNNVWHVFLLSWNYDGNNDDALAWILNHPNCDRGTILVFLSRNMSEFLNHIEKDDFDAAYDRYDQQFFRICKRACERLERDEFASSKYFPYEWSDAEYIRAVEITKSHYSRNIENGRPNQLSFKPHYFKVRAVEFAISKYDYQNYHLGIRFDVWLKSKGVSADDPIFAHEFRHWKDQKTRFYFT